MERNNFNSVDSLAEADEKAIRAQADEPLVAVKIPPEHDVVAIFYNCSYIALNILSSVGIVLVNKLIYKKFEFNFGTLLTAIHFAVTAVCLKILSYTRILERKPIEIEKVFPLCVSFCGFVVLTNLSLQYNSVGFYQMAKVLTTPCVAIIQFLFYKVRFSRGIIAALTVTCGGVAIATFSEVDLTALGLVLAISGVVVTSLYQIWVGTKQKELNVNAMQLLYYQAPISALLLMPCTVLLEDLDALANYPFKVGACLVILASSLLAVLVNVSTFLIIGKTSAITYNMVGHTKLSLILLFGYIFFDGKLSLGNLAGVFVTLIGIFAYSYLNLKK